MYVLLLSVLAASLLGSLHCVGMCGGFVAFYAGGDESSKADKWRAHLSYSGGRWFAYTLLGVTVGFAGAALNLAGRAAGLQRSAAVIAGVVMVVWGIAMLSWQRKKLGFQPKIPVRLQNWLLSLHRNFQNRPPTLRAFLLGMMAGILPCGWLYAFVLTAAATASPIHGGLVMTAFWMGTLPAMLGLGVGLQWLSMKFRSRLPTLSAVTILVLGMLTLWHRATLPVMMPARAAIQRAQKKTPKEHLKQIQSDRKKGHCACSKMKKKKTLKTSRKTKSKPSLRR